jgi:hypothetical protein
MMGVIAFYAISYYSLRCGTYSSIGGFQVLCNIGLRRQSTGSHITCQSKCTVRFVGI